MKHAVPGMSLLDPRRPVLEFENAQSTHECGNNCSATEPGYVACENPLAGRIWMSAVEITTQGGPP